MMNKKDQIQENQYQFPYHYIPTRKHGNFQTAQILKWGYEYQSYLEYLVSIILKNKTQSILDVGCGDGRLLYELEKHDQLKKLVGVDLSKKAIQFAKAFSQRTEFLVEDITKDTTLGNEFGLVTLIEVLEHIPPKDIPNFLRGISKHMNSKSRLIVTVPSDNLPTQAKHYQHFSAVTLTETLKPFFEVIELNYLNKFDWFTLRMQRFIANKYYIITWQPLLNKLYTYYKKTRLETTHVDGKRIYCLCRLKQ